MSEPAPKLQAWGQLKPDAVYIKRPEDDEVESYLCTGKSCLVTASRQAGKSSLRVKLTEHLRQKHGFLVCSIELSEDSKSHDGVWFRSLFRKIKKELSAQVPDSQNAWLDKLLSTHEETNWVQTWHSAILELSKRSDAKKGLVLLFDEVESALDRRSFFAGLRAAHDELSARHGPRFVFCLLGKLATSGQLLSNGLQLLLKLPDLQRVPLTPFSRVDLQGFVPALAGFVKVPAAQRKLLNELYDWTNGQPYLTQRILYELRRSSLQSGLKIDTIPAVVDQLFLRKDREDDDFLATAQHRVKEGRKTDAGDFRIKSMLSLYRRVLKQEEGLPYQPDDEFHEELLLLGLCRVSDNRLVPASRITQAVFDQKWLAGELTGVFVAKQLQTWIDSHGRPEMRAKSALLTSEALEKLPEWQKHQDSDLDPTLKDYIQRSRDNQDRKQDRERYVRIGLFLLISIAISGLLMWALSYRSKLLEMQKHEQELERDLATAKVQIAELGKAQEQLLQELKKATGVLKDRAQWIAKIEKDLQNNAVDLTKQRETIERLGTQRKEVSDLRKQLAASQSREKELQRNLEQIKQAKSNPEKDVERPKIKRGASSEAGVTKPQLFRHPGPVTAAIFLSDDNQLITGTNKGTIFFWNTGKATRLAEQPCHVTRVAALAISADDRYVASAGRDGQICIFDTHGEARLAKFVAHSGGVNAIAFSSDGKLLLSGGDDKTAKLWEVPSGKLLATQQQDSSVSAVAFSGNDRYLMLGDASKSVHWIERDGRGKLILKRTLEGHAQYISFLWMNETATRALVGTGNGVVYQWQMDVTPPSNRDNSAQIHTINKQAYGRPYKGEVMDVRRYPDSLYDLSTNDSGVTWIWETFSGLPMQELAHPRPATARATNTWQKKLDNTARFSRDGKYVVTGSDDGYARVWRVKTKN